MQNKPVKKVPERHCVGCGVGKAKSELIRIVRCPDGTVDIDFKGRILVAAGWKPGFSTDNDAVLLAEKLGAKTVVNLSNIEKVYTDDPRTNPDAKPLDTISWDDFRKMVGDEWTPGKNCPFDPIASKRAASNGISVICAGGKNIENIRNILDDKDFIGTKIG